MIEAKVICDSISPTGSRLTTFELRYPKMVHGELMTHRAFSRNASSSRAIPTAKYLAEVRSDTLRAEPVFWGKNQKGMQAAEQLTGEELMFAKARWRWAALDAANHAEKMAGYGAHKQIVNRILEPFLHINVVMTSCEPGLMNFFGLRLDAAAQPEIRLLATLMFHAYQRSTPKRLSYDEWHLPYVTDLDRSRCSHDNDQLIRVSVARCARVSYRSFETGKESTLAEDFALFQRLVVQQPIHASPAEHQATPDRQARVNAGDDWDWEHPELWGNLVGWKQFRKSLLNEDCAPLPEEYRSAS